MRTTQGQRFFERRMQAFDGNVIVSLAQLDVLLDQNRRLKAQIEELEDKLIDQVTNQEDKDFNDYKFETVLKSGQRIEDTLDHVYRYIPDVQAMRIIDRRYNKIVTNYDELRPQDYK